MDSLSREELRQLPYIQLKQYAKRQGVKKINLKAGKLISAILSASSRADETLESFTTCDESLDYSIAHQSQVPHEVSNIGNMSSRRRSRRITQVFSAEKTPEENQPWSEDSEIELKTPTSILKRSLTFSVEVPVIPVDQTCVISTNPPAITPAKAPRRSILCHGKKSLLVKHGKSSGSKVNFITPDRMLLRRSTSNSETPLRSVKDRPKTPVAVNLSVKRKRVPSPFPGKSAKHVKTVNEQNTPTSPNSVTGKTKIKLDFKEIHQKAFNKMEDLEEYHKRLHKRMATLTRSQKSSRRELTPSVKGSAQKSNSPEKISNSKTDSVCLKPSRIPQPFRGIPFIPVVKSLRKIDTNFAGQTQSSLHSTSKNYVGNENPIRRCQRSLFTPGSASTVFQFGKDHLQENSSTFAVEKHTPKKFDLKASLARKLPYKPYRGVLRPLSDSNANQSELTASCLDAIKKKRQESREILKGVRKNRRFELQMSRRGIS